MSSLSDDTIRRCPYNKNHVVSSSKFQRHIVKCEKNYKAMSKMMCPFNATHRLSRSEIAEHIESCPSRHIATTYGEIVERDTLYSRYRKDEPGSFSSATETISGEERKVCRSTSSFANVDQNYEFERDDVESIVSSIDM